ncbi:MAG TPA: tripartite tricarboxylate transporter substrate binding protein [Xanthobacteraceae bacterium]|jgi:tripartite-type tricarboxylate transporter receptor subunit TctC
MKMTAMAARRSARSAGLACALIGLMWSTAAVVDSYPDRPVTIVVPYTPGGSTDILGRYEADLLQRELHQTFVVENRPGAGSAIGVGYVAKSAPDGYTLLHAPTSLVLLPYLMKSVSYDPVADLDPIVLTGLTEFSLVVSPSLNVKSVADLIALAKAKPGALTYASAGIGTPHQLFAELFKSMANLDIRHIPYKGAMPGLLDVAAGNVSMEFVDLAPALPLIQSGKLKILALTADKRSKDMPNVPTISETVPGYEANGWQGLFARAGTPKYIVNKLNEIVDVDLRRPETAERLKVMGIDAQGDTPQQFAAFIAAESAKWGKVIHGAGITPQ